MKSPRRGAENNNGEMIDSVSARNLNLFQALLCGGEFLQERSSDIYYILYKLHVPFIKQYIIVTDNVYI